MKDAEATRVGENTYDVRYIGHSKVEAGVGVEFLNAMVASGYRVRVYNNGFPAPSRYCFGSLGADGSVIWTHEHELSDGYVVVFQDASTKTFLDAYELTEWLWGSSRPYCVVRVLDGKFKLFDSNPDLNELRNQLWQE